MTTSCLAYVAATESEGCTGLLACFDRIASCGERRYVLATPYLNDGLLPRDLYIQESPFHD